MGGRNALAQRGCFRGAAAPPSMKGSCHDSGALRVSAIALSAAAFILSSPLSAADAATVAHHYRHAAHPRVSHGSHGQAFTGMSHMATQAIATTFGETDIATFTAMVIIFFSVADGVTALPAAGYPYCGDTDHGSYYGSCDDYSYGYPYPYYDYGYGWGGPVFAGAPASTTAFTTASTGASVSTGNGADFAGRNKKRGQREHMWAAFRGAASSAAVISPAANSGHAGGLGGGQFGGGHFAGVNVGHVGGFGGGQFGGGHVAGGKRRPRGRIWWWPVRRRSFRRRKLRPRGRLRRRPRWAALAAASGRLWWWAHGRLWWRPLRRWAFPLTHHLADGSPLGRLRPPSFALARCCRGLCPY